MDLLTILMLVALLILAAYVYKKEPGNLPPGPTRWPLIGALPIMLRTMHRFTPFLLECQRKYGDVVYFATGPTRGMAVVCRLDLIRKLFIEHADISSCRPRNMWLANHVFKGKGIVFNRATWKETRKFALKGMKDFGLGKDIMTHRIQEIALALSRKLQQPHPNAFDPKEWLQKTVSNVIANMLFGKRFGYEDEEFNDILSTAEAIFKANIPLNPMNYLPALRHLGFIVKKFNVHNYTNLLDDVKGFINKQIEFRRKTFDVNDVQCMVDMYLLEEKTGFVKYTTLDEEQLFISFLQMFNAGVDTTTGTLGWFLLYMINYPDTQQRCRQEIERNLGGKLAEYSDQHDLPFTLATLYETMRLSPVAPGTLPHVLDDAIELDGYIIPKDTAIFAYTLAMYRDTKVWGEDVLDFRPERWLSEDGSIKKFDEFIPFGIGRRSCVAEQLAKVEIFILAVTLLQKFVFSPDDPDNPPAFKGQEGLTYTPLPYVLRAEPVPEI